MFQKLQLEIEQAIRKADSSRAGNVSQLELATCLFHLGYLKQPASDHFTEHLWLLMNPRKQNLVSNATVYDLLLLLSYKVTLSVPQLTTAVSEYLHTLYSKQLKFDVDSFGIVVSDNGSGLSHKTKTVNAYLAHLAIPPVSKACLTFKQLHTLRYTASVRKNSRSPSPLESTGIKPAFAPNTTTLNQKKTETGDTKAKGRYEQLFYQQHKAEKQFDLVRNKILATDIETRLAARQDTVSEAMN